MDEWATNNQANIEVEAKRRVWKIGMAQVQTVSSRALTFFFSFSFIL
jgi:hypothetical protein